MKTDSKLKPEKRPPKAKAVKSSRAASMPNGKHPLALYEHIPIGVVEASLDGKYMDVNEEFCRILGYSRKELLRRGIKDYTYEEDYGIDARLYEQLIAGKIPFYRIEKRFVRRDGGIIWVELTRSLVCDPKGKPLYTLGVALDISDRKDVEKVLRDSAERLRLATAAAQMFMWEWDFQTESYTIADNFEQALGFSAGLLPKNKFETVWALCPKEDLQGISERFEKAVENQSDLHALPCRVINPENGQIVWLEVSAKIVYDRNGKPERMFGVAQNITANKRMEDTLRGSEERFRAMVSQTTAGIAESDLDSRLVFVNPGFCEMLGYSEEELLGKTVWELTYTEDLEKNRRLFNQMLEQGESYQFEKRFIHKDGSLLWTSVTVTNVHDPAGKPTGGVGVVLSIDKRKQVEDTLTQYARQQEALYGLSDQLHRTESLADIFDASLDAILNALQCDRASILLFDVSDVMHFVAWRGLSDAYRKSTDGHSPWTPDVEDPQPVVMNDVRAAELTEPLRAVIQEEGIGSLAFIPLVSNGKLIGKFMVYFDTPHTFEEGDLDLSLTIARQLASGIDRKRAEDALARERETLERLFETMPVMVSMIDPESNSMRLNTEFERRTGWKSEEVTVLSLLEALYPDPEYRQRVLQRMAEARRNEWVEVQVQARDGRTLDTMWSNISIVEDQKLVMGIAIGIDITERKQTEKRLTLLAEISEMLRNVDDPSELMYTISKVMGEHLGARRVLFNEIDLEQDREIVYRDYHNGLDSVAGVHKVSEYSSITSAEVGSGKTVVNVDSKIDPRTAQEYEKIYAVSKERAYVAVPLMRDNRWVASFWVSDDSPRQWTSEEVSLLETVAERTWAIIEKLRINEALRESERRFREMINALPAAIYTTDAEGMLTHFNPAAVAFSGRTPELGTDKWCVTWKLYYPDGTPMPHEECPMALTLKEGRIVSGVEAIAERPDGSRLWFEPYPTPLLDSEGRLVGGINMLVDITERKRAEANLAFLVEISQDLTRLQGVDEIMESVGTKIGAYLNLSRCVFAEIDEADVGVAAHDWHREDMPGIAGVYRIEDFVTDEFRRASRAGEIIIVRDTVADPRADAQQFAALKVGSFISVPLVRGGQWKFALNIYHAASHDWREDEIELMRELTDRIWTRLERVRAEDELRRSEEHLRLATDVAQMYSWEYDLKTLETKYSENTERITGQKPPSNFAEALALIHPDDRALVSQVFEEAIASQDQFAIEVRALGLNDQIAWYLVTGMIVRSQAGEPVRAIGISQSITERKRAEANLAFLAEVSQDLVGLTNIEETVNRLGEKIGRFFGVKQCLFAEHADEFKTAIASYGWHAEGAPNLKGTYQIRDFLSDELMAVMMTGEPLVVSETQRDGRLSAESYGALGIRSFIIVPLVREREGRFQISVIDDKPRDWREDEIELMCELTTRIWMWLERARAEDALRESEARYRFIVENTSDGIWQTELAEPMPLSLSEEEQIDWYYKHAVMRQCNLGLARMYGYNSVDEVVGLPMRILMPRENPVNLGFSQQFVRSGYRLVDAESYEVSKDGSQLVFLNNMIGIIEDGKLKGEWGTNRDNTERKRAEEDLRQSEEQFRRVFSNNMVAMGIWTKTGGIISANDALLELIGYTREELEAGKINWAELTPPEGHERDLQAVAEVEEKGYCAPYEKIYIHKDGRPIPIVIGGGRFDERIGAGILFAVDISARKQAEEALQQLNTQLEERVLNRTAKLRAVNQTLREEIAERQRVEEALRKSETLARANEKKLSTLFDLLPVGISFLDPEGQIIQVNPALTHITKLSREQLTGRTYQSRKYIRPNGTVMSPTEFASQRALTEGQTVYNVETGMVLEHGEVVWTSVSAAPVNVADVSAAVVTVDITESKRAERALRESRQRLQILSQRLVEVQEEERRAIARELHDRVGQTLAALNINLIIISDQLEGRVDEQTHARLNDSMKLTAETIALVRDVMSNLRPSVLDDYGLEAAVDSHLAQFRSRYEINVRFEKPEQPIPRLGPSVEMTFLRVAQEALMNIAKHAQASQVNLSLWQEENTICMSIQDNGIGIESWQEANQPGSHGLTIMRERAEAFGGHLRVSSIPGKGTKVEVKLPVETNDPSQLQKGKSE